MPNYLWLQCYEDLNVSDSVRYCTVAASNGLCLLQKGTQQNSQKHKNTLVLDKQKGGNCEKYSVKTDLGYHLLELNFFSRML